MKLQELISRLVDKSPLGDIDPEVEVIIVEKETGKLVLVDMSSKTLTTLKKVFKE